MSTEGKPEEPLPSLLSVLAMPVSLVLTVGALGLGLLIGIETGGESSVAAPTTTETTTGPPTAEGQQVFASQGCGGCHTLKAAGASGTVGPNLDQTQLTEDQIVDVVTNGRSGTAMSPFKDRLTPEQIQAVAAFVSASKSP